MVAGSSGAGQVDTDFFLKESFVFICAFVAFNRRPTTEQNPLNRSTIQRITSSPIQPLIYTEEQKIPVSHSGNI